VAVIIYLTTSAPAPLTDQLILAGHQVREALAISEVLHLLDAEHVDVVLVGADVVNGRKKAAALGSIAIILEPAATIKEILWELELLFPGSNKLIHPLR
jgi:hypothetical protein